MQSSSISSISSIGSIGSIGSPAQLETIINKSDISHFSIILIENEITSVDNPLSDYSLLIKDYDSQKHVAMYDFLTKVEKKKHHETGGAIARRVEHIKEFMQKPDTKESIAEMFMEHESKNTPSYKARRKEGYTLSYQDQAAIASGVIHIAAIIEPTIIGKEDNGKRVVQVGNLQLDNLDVKQKILKEVPPSEYYIPRKMETR